MGGMRGDVADEVLYRMLSSSDSHWSGPFQTVPSLMSLWSIQMIITLLKLDRLSLASIRIQ